MPWATIAAFSPEVAVHCAWIATPGVYHNSPVNSSLVSQSVEMFSKLSQLGVSHLVGCGTCAEYAPSTGALTEGASPILPDSPYARAKHELHLQLLKAAELFGNTLTWLRIFYPFGPSEHPQRLVSSLIRAFRTGQVPHLSHPFAERDYIHVSDVASAILTSVQHRAAGCYNVGTGEAVRLVDLRAMIAEMLGFDRGGFETDRHPSQEGVDRVVASTARIRSLPWTRKFDMRAGLSTYGLSSI
jgi:nucleoside-diphosphate-sugar epimerase